MVYFQNKIYSLLWVMSKQIVSPILLSCQPRVIVATFFVYKVMGIAFLGRINMVSSYVECSVQVKIFNRY